MRNSLSEKLANYIVGTSIDKLDEKIGKEVRKAILDSLIVGITGFKLTNLPKTLQYLLGLGKGKSTLYDLTTKGNPITIATINSASTHILEFDDWIPEAYVHPGCVVVPASIAVAEDQKLTWSDLLEAVVIGYEVMSRVGAVLGRSHYKIFHTTGTAGVFGATAAASKLLRLDLSKIVSALGIAGAFTSGLWEFISIGSGIKPLSPAYATMKGLLATYLAKEGFKGPPEILEGSRGLLKALPSDGNIRFIDIPPWDHAILRNNYKPYPTCRHTHTAIEAALDLRSKMTTLRASDISCVEVEVYDEAYNVAGLRNPKSIEEARFSVSYCVAVALKYGKLGLKELKLGLEDDDVKAIESLTSVKVNEEFTKAYPRKQQVKIKVKSITGETYVSSKDYPLGSVEKPLTLDMTIVKSKDLLTYANINVDIENLLTLLTIGCKEIVDLTSIKP